MTVVNYATLFDHTPHLQLRYDPADTRPWQIRDGQRDQLYARATTLTQAVRFMRAQAKRGDATVDEMSITLHVDLADLWADIASGEPTAREATRPGSGSEPLVSQAPPGVADEPASPDDFSRKVTAQVLPFRRPAEPLDEVAG